MTRRDALLLLSAAGAAGPARAMTVSELVSRNDESVARYLERQNTDPASRWRGAVPDAFGLHEPGTAAGILTTGMAAFLHPQSKFHRDGEVRGRIKLAAEHLARVQTSDGNFDLLVTNFNSPPDSAFIMINVGTAASLARDHGQTEMFGWIEPTMRKAAEGLIKGGIHTPNHRWVTCAAMAQINHVIPDPALIRRIDQWLSEGIDIDSDGQYSEQSTTEYNAITNNALVMVAERLKRDELLEPVRKNLEAMMHLLHPGYEVVTEISQRQDRNVVGNMGRYWLSLRYMARKDNDGRYETLANEFEPRYASLAQWMDFKSLQSEGPAPAALPTNYEKEFPNSNLVHIRRGETSAALILSGNSRFFSLRRGQAVINGVRFASAFFGKGQFIPEEGRKRGEGYYFEQSLEGPYYQPFDSARKQPWGVDAWRELRAQRRQTEVAEMRYSAEVHEKQNGFDLNIEAAGTDNVPLAIEINLREGGTIEGVEALEAADSYLLSRGEARYTRGGDTIRFGPGIAETSYTQVRGAQDKLSGPSVYLTTFTPVKRTIRFRW